MTHYPVWPETYHLVHLKLIVHHHYWAKVGSVSIGSHWTLTGDSQYLKLRGILHGNQSGQIYAASTYLDGKIMWRIKEWPDQCGIFTSKWHRPTRTLWPDWTIVTDPQFGVEMSWPVFPGGKSLPQTTTFRDKLCLVNYTCLNPFSILLDPFQTQCHLYWPIHIWSHSSQNHSYY